MSFETLFKVACGVAVAGAGYYSYQKGKRVGKEVAAEAVTFVIDKAQLLVEENAAAQQKAA